MKKLLLLFITLVSLQLTAQNKFSDSDIQNFLKENLEELNLTNGDISDYVVTKSFESNKGLISHISIAQAIDGVPIEDAIINLTISNKDNSVVYYGNRFIDNISSKIVSENFSINSEDAIASVQGELGYVTRSAPKLLKEENGKTTYEKPVFADRDLLTQKKYFYNKKTQTLHPTWEVEISMLNSDDYWIYKIDANNSEVLAKRNLTLYCNFGHSHQSGNAHNCNEKEEHATDTPIKTMELKPNVSGSYNVYPVPVEAPSFGDQEIVVNPHFENASPFGWHDTNGASGNEFTITRGNNVHAYETDLEGGPSNGMEPDGGDNLVFDFEYEDLAEPQDLRDVTLTQLFYIVNIVHDITYALGFDEASGNFQQNNYGNGGAQNDQALATLDYTFQDNASMGTPGDGGSPTLRMGVFNQTSSAVRVLSPAEIEGGIQFSGVAAGWGFPNYEGFDVTAELAIAFDGNAQGATQCCDDIVNATDVQGKIAIIDRGGCEFGTKGLKAQEAGAVGCIVCNVPGVNGGDGEEGISMGPGADGPSVTIPTIFLPTSMCNRFRASINSGTPVVMQIKPDESGGPTLRGTALDNGIIIHEFMHGISNRLGNGLNSEEQMGEGWSDYLALVFSHEGGDTGADARGIGTYALGQNVTGDGIRRFPYSTDMSINPQSYADLPSSGVPHPVGELWVAMTWDMYWNFVDEYGFDPTWKDPESGNFKAVRLVFEGLKLQPASPGFVDGRNAIIGADQILYDGENECLIWDAFSRRGLGINADQGNPNDLADGTVSFDNTLRCNPRLDIKREVSDLITAGSAINVTTTVTNFTEAEQTNVTVKEVIDPNLSFVDGSSNFPATVDGNEISFEIGTMVAEDEAVLTYELATPNNASTTRYYDDLQDNSQYRVDFEGGGFNNWAITTDEARSGTRSVNIPDVTMASDIRMVYDDLQVPNNSPAFRFWHKYETNSGSNGGFVEISTDGTLWFPIADKMIRNGYNSIISYANLVIPNLQGYTGNNLEEWQDVLIDLSDYAGQTVSMRFRFATADPADITGLEALRGWYVDDVEMMNLVSYITSACASSDQFTEVCTEDGLTIVDSDADVSTEDQELDNNLNMSMYPNPANDHVVIQLNSTENYSAELSIDNLDGKKVYSTLINIDNVTSITKINTSNFPKGMYMVKIQSGNAVKTKKLVIN